MKICLFCENQYAIGILMPLQEEADREGGNDVLWYVHEKKIPDFPLKDSVRYTNSIHRTKTWRKIIRRIINARRRTSKDR